MDDWEASEGSFLGVVVVSWDLRWSHQASLLQVTNGKKAAANAKLKVEEKCGSQKVTTDRDCRTKGIIVIQIRGT